MRGDTKRYSTYIFVILFLLISLISIITEFQSFGVDLILESVFLGFFYGLGFTLFIHLILGIISISTGHGEKIAFKVGGDRDHTFRNLHRDMAQRVEWQ